VRLRLLRVAERRLAEDLAHRLARGGDFASLARAHSVDPSAPQGGELGAVRVQDLAEPLRSSVGRLTPGQISPILRTPAGYVIVQRER
jgi:parvulin-like peptidyl-prolyl isomerase